MYEEFLLSSNIPGVAIDYWWVVTGDNYIYVLCRRGDPLVTPRELLIVIFYVSWRQVEKGLFCV